MLSCKKFRKKSPSLRKWQTIVRQKNVAGDTIISYPNVNCSDIFNASPWRPTDSQLLTEQKTNDEASSACVCLQNESTFRQDTQKCISKIGLQNIF